MKAPKDAIRGDWAKRLAWAPIVFLLVAMLWLRVSPSRFSFESHFLILVLNFFFSTLAGVFVAYLAGRSFLIQGSPAVLLLGCGVLTWGAAGVVANSFSHGDPNLDVTIHNCGVWVSALFHFMGTVLLLEPRDTLRAPRFWLGAGYLGALGRSDWGRCGRCTGTRRFSSYRARAERWCGSLCSARRSLCLCSQPR